MSWAEVAAICSALGAVLAVVITSMLTVGKIGRMAGVMEATLNNQNIAVGDLKTEMKALALVVTQQAVQSNRIDALSETVLRMDKRIDDLAHGEGFVFPLSSSFKPSK